MIIDHDEDEKPPKKFFGLKVYPKRPLDIFTVLTIILTCAGIVIAREGWPF